MVYGLLIYWLCVFHELSSINDKRKTTTYHYREGDVREYIKDELKTTNNRIDMLSKQINSLANKLDGFKNKVYELLDKVMLELKAIREEQTLITGKQSEHTDSIEDHETRIGKLEQVLQP